MNATEEIKTAIAKSLPEWHSIVSESFVPLDVTRSVPGDFLGRIRSRALDEIALCEVTANGHNVLRTPELIARNDRMYFKLSLQISGTGLLIQDNREAVMRPGDLAVYDTHRPYTLAFDEDFRVLVMMFPHELIDLPVDAVGQLTAVRMAGDEGLGRVISPFLVGMSGNLDQLNGPSGRRLSLNALDLVTTMFANELAIGRQGIDPSEGLLGHIRTFIDAHLSDSELGPSTIAAAHYISTRHLHNLFQASGTTVAAWIRSRRLEHCRRDLRDPVCAGRPVAAIAARWGFFDAAHFSRVFKAAFSESPSAYRAAA
ncbi:MAG: helix-turn-helix domain-containing protein [Sciscionella sp.]